MTPDEVLLRHVDEVKGGLSSQQVEIVEHIQLLPRPLAEAGLQSGGGGSRGISYRLGDA